MAATLETTKMLGLKLKSENGLHQAVLDGLPYSALTRFLEESGLPPKAVYAVLHIPPRTLARRKVSGRLSSDESGHLLRLGALFRTVVKFFADRKDVATDWMTTSIPGLDFCQPIELAKTEIGTKRVETLIYQLDYGIVV